MTLATETLDQLAIDTIRTLSIDGVQKANSGHPGAPMGAAQMAYTLWTRFLRHAPTRPDWPDRDRFVLSAGHASMLLYSLLHLTGYDVSLEDLKSFRQWGSKTPGHPEYRLTPGVEATTGPLGQGFANALAIEVAREDERPSLIAIRTHIGFGSPNRQDTQKAHGQPLGADEVRLVKEAYGWDPDAQFLVPDKARELFRRAIPAGEAIAEAWHETFVAYEKAFPDLASELRRRLDGRLAKGWDAGLKTYPIGEEVATRNASQEAI